MVFIAPPLGVQDAQMTVAGVWVAFRGRKKRLLRVMQFLIDKRLFRLANFQHTSREVLHSTSCRTTQPPNFASGSRCPISAYSLTSSDFRRLPYKPQQEMWCQRSRRSQRCAASSQSHLLCSVANEFGGSRCAYSCVFNRIIALLYSNHRHVLYFNRAIVAARISTYCDAIARKGALMRTCWAFIDGTK